jgi:hypothetical protein
LNIRILQDTLGVWPPKEGDDWYSARSELKGQQLLKKPSQAFGEIAVLGGCGDMTRNTGNTN